MPSGATEHRRQQNHQEVHFIGWVHPIVVQISTSPIPSSNKSNLHVPKYNPLPDSKILFLSKAFISVPLYKPWSSSNHHTCFLHACSRALHRRVAYSPLMASCYGPLKQHQRTFPIHYNCSDRTRVIEWDKPKLMQLWGQYFYVTQQPFQFDNHSSPAITKKKTKKRKKKKKDSKILNLQKPEKNDNQTDHLHEMGCTPVLSTVSMSLN